MHDINKKTLFRVFLYVCGCIILYWLLHETERVWSFFGTVSDILAPFIFGGVLAFILNVPMRAIENGILKKMENKGLKRLLAVVLTFIALLLVIALVFRLLIPEIIATVNSLIPALYAFLTEAEKAAAGFLEENPQIMEWLNANFDTQGLSWASMAEKALSVFGNSVSTLLGGAVSAIGSIFDGVFNGVIGVVFSVYCLFQKETLARQGRKLLYAFVKERTADRVARILRLTNTTFSNFLSGQCVEVCILGVLFAVTMAIFRMPYIPLISVVIAITAFIPIVGAWVGCIIGAFLILVQSPMLAILFVAMFLVLQLIENNMIYPRVVGTSVGLSGMWVLVAVAIGGEVMGVIGMFLMIPVASVLYTLLREFTNKRLQESSVALEKLQPQPPELCSKFKEKREHKKKKNLLKKMMKQEQKQSKNADKN